MSVTFTRTREQLRSMVLRKLGVIGTSTSVVSADADVVYEAIDLRLKELPGRGVIWRGVNPRTADFTIPANIRSASAASIGDVQFPLAIHVVNGSVDQAVQIIGAKEYADLFDKNAMGVPEKAMWTGSRSAEFIFWPIPTANTTAKLTYQRLLEDTSAGAATDVDVSMLRWLKDIVAYDVGDDFGMDEGRMQRFMKEAAQAEKNIRKLTVERKDFAPVAVDEWGRPDQRETDYGVTNGF